MRFITCLSSTGFYWDSFYSFSVSSTQWNAQYGIHAPSVASEWVNNSRKAIQCFPRCNRLPHHPQTSDLPGFAEYSEQLVPRTPGQSDLWHFSHVRQSCKWGWGTGWGMQLICSNQVRDCFGIAREEGREGKGQNMKGYEKAFGGDGNIYYLHCSDDFTDFKCEPAMYCMSIILQQGFKKTFF